MQWSFSTALILKGALSHNGINSSLIPEARKQEHQLQLIFQFSFKDYPGDTMQK